MRAWFAGDFTRCLDLCDAVRARDVESISQIALLRARTLLRVGRPEEALRVVNDVFVAHGTLDASLTAQMMLGTAEINLGDVAGGVARLERARLAATRAHSTVRSEIALRLANGYYARRDLDRAQSMLAEVSPDADIISALALNYRAWIESARGDHDAATEYFIAAVERLDRCRRQDRQMEANALEALSHLAAERFDVRAWAFIEERAERIDWTAQGLATSRFWITMSAALIHEAAGEARAALAAARRATELAPSPAYRALALCRRSAIARGTGESYSPADFVDEARALFDSVATDLHADETIAALAIAQESAHAGDFLTGGHYLDLHRSLRPTALVSALSADPRVAAYEDLVTATIADVRGDAETAQREYGAAFRAFRALGFTRRAVEAALRLAELSKADDLFAYVASATAALSPQYWVRRAMRRRERLYADPVARRLTASEREVLVLLCEGLTNEEIARARCGSCNTVKHIVTDLLKAFGVRNRQELIIECSRRRIGA